MKVVGVMAATASSISFSQVFASSIGVFSSMVRSVGDETSEHQRQVRGGGKIQGPMWE